MTFRLSLSCFVSVSAGMSLEFCHSDRTCWRRTRKVQREAIHILALSWLSHLSLLTARGSWFCVTFSAPRKAPAHSLLPSPNLFCSFVLDLGRVLSPYLSEVHFFCRRLAAARGERGYRVEILSFSVWALGPVFSPLPALPEFFASPALPLSLSFLFLAKTEVIRSHSSWVQDGFE